MTWVTIYDARSSWGFWFQGLFGAFWLGTSLWLAYVFFFVAPRKPRPARGVHPIVAGLVLVPLIIALAGLFLWGAAADYRDRSDLSAGRFSEAEGVVEAANFVNGSRSTTMYVRLGPRWFQVPYGHPQDCWPHVGEPIRLAFRPTEDRRMWFGLPAYTVLRMDLTHGCRIRVWG